jgi:hypothetical protein
MGPILPALLAVIVVVGLVHTMASHYRDKALQRRKREALLRITYQSWRAPD